MTDPVLYWNSVYLPGALKKVIQISYIAKILCFKCGLEKRYVILPISPHALNIAIIDIRLLIWTTQWIVTNVFQHYVLLLVSNCDIGN